MLTLNMFKDLAFLLFVERVVSVEIPELYFKPSVVDLNIKPISTFSFYLRQKSSTASDFVFKYIAREEWPT